MQGVWRRGAGDFLELQAGGLLRIQMEVRTEGACKLFLVELTSQYATPLSLEIGSLKRTARVNLFFAV